MQHDMTPAALLRLLCSEKGEERSKALSDLIDTGCAMLVHVKPNGIQLSTTAHPDLMHLFTGLLYAAQVVGSRLGLTMQWLQDPSQRPSQQLVVPAGDFSNLKVLK